MKKSLLLIATLLALPALGADTVIQSDKLKLGKPGSATDKVIELNFGLGAANPKMRATNATKKWEFSNDGTLYKSFGSGSGGGSGIELLADNPGLEAGVTQSMSASAPSTVTAITGSNALFETTSFQFLPTISGQTYETQAYAIPKGLQGGPCLAAIYYTSAEVSNLINGAVYSGAGTLLSQQIPFTRNVGPAAPLYIPFTCPTSGTVKIRMTSTGSVIAGLVGDNLHLGSETRLKEIDQSGVVGGIDFPAASGCLWTITAGTYQDFPAQSLCSAPVVTGDAIAPVTRLPQVTFPALKANVQYEMSGELPIQPDSSGNCDYQITDGTKVIWATRHYTIDNRAFVAHFSYSSDQTNVTFKIQAADTVGGGANACDINNRGDLGANARFQMVLKKSPSPAQMITAGTGQAASWSGSVTGTTDLTSLTLADFPGTAVVTQRTNRNMGSVIASASNGISFTPSVAGLWKVCASGQINSSTTNASWDVILADGSNNPLTEKQTGTQAAAGGSTTFGRCASINIASVTALQTVKLRGDSNLGLISTNDVEWTIEQLDSGRAGAAFPGVVSVPVSPQMQLVSATFGGASNPSACTSDPCTVYSQTGSWVTAINRTSTGSYSVHMAGFSSAPYCWGMSQDVIGSISMSGDGFPTSTLAKFAMWSTSTGVDEAGTIFCLGPK